MISYRPYFYTLFSSLLWASTPAVAKLLLNENLKEIQILPITTSISFLVLFLISVYRNKIFLIKSYGQKDFAFFSLMAFLGIFIYSLLLYMAIDRMPAQEAFIINYLWPILTAIFASFVLKEGVTFKKIAGLLMAFVGVVLIGSKGNISELQFSNLTGVLMAVTAAASYAMFSVMGKRFSYDRISTMTIYYFLASLYFVLFSSLRGAITLSFSVAEWAGIAWLGISTGVGFLAWFMALKHGDTSKVSNIIFLTPFMSLIYIRLLVNEPILLSSFLGLLFIMFGILIQAYKSRSRNLKI